MERATRERLTGAVILVAALAILVPEMLSGPGGDDRSDGNADVLAETGPPLTTYELPLNPAGTLEARNPQAASEPAGEPVLPPATAAADAASGASETSASSATSAAPATSATSTASATSPQARVNAPAESGDQPATVRPAAPATSPRPAPVTAAPPARAAATSAAASGAWWVQLGSFASEQNAQGLARKLRDRGFSIDVSKVRSGSRDLYRVRAGPEPNRDAATALRSKLAAAGTQGTLVAP